MPGVVPALVFTWMWLWMSPCAHANAWPARDSATVSTAALTLKNLFTLSVLLYVTIKKAKKKTTEMTEDVKYFPDA